MAEVLPYIGVAVFTLFLVGIAMANRGMKKAPFLEDDQVTPEAPFPGPTVVHLSVSDRLDARQQATPAELEALKRAMKKLREQWGDQVMVEELIQEVDRKWEKR